MRRFSFLIGLLMALICLTGCPPHGDKLEECLDLQRAEYRDFTGLDGCKWVLILDNGDKLEPINWADFDVQPEENKAVGIHYTSYDGASVCMVGELVELHCIEPWG